MKDNAYRVRSERGEVQRLLVGRGDAARGLRDGDGRDPEAALKRGMGPQAPRGLVTVTMWAGALRTTVPSAATKGRSSRSASARSRA